MDPTGISGVVMGALLTEVITMARVAKRCQENCKKLADTLDFASPIINNLHQSSNKRSIEVEEWLGDFKKTLEIAKEEVSHCIPTSRLKTMLSYRRRVKLSKNLMLIEAKISEKISRSNLLQFGMIEEMYQRQIVNNVIIEDFEYQPTPNIIVAFEGEPFQNLLRHILSVDDLSGEPMTIGLKGQGGAGKTLLAKMVYNDSSIQEKFGRENMIYVTVGRDATLLALYRVMAEKLQDGGVFEKKYVSRSREDQRAYLHGRFLKKRVLLVLDDVWDDSGIISVLDLAKGLGSVTLVTTRNKVVLSNMKAHVTLDVQTLSRKESWKLFSSHAFGSIMPSHDIENLAQDICAECNGLPLALEVIGSSMWEKKDVRHWVSTLSHMRNSQNLCNSSLVEERLFRCLEYSYEKIEDASKKCFLYVAAYPEDFDIPVEELCSIWLGDDIFDSFATEEGMQLAWTHLTSLADRSLIDLHPDGKTMKVHDVLRDLAIRIIREAKPTEWAYGCYFHPGRSSLRLPQGGAFKRMSLIGSTICELPINFQVPELLVCSLSKLQVGKDMRSMKFPKDFFGSMKKLQILDLSFIARLGLSEDDSSNDSRESLPNFEALHSLVSLNLSRCYSLRELPESIKELKSLVSLNLSGCSSLVELPESIKELKSLVSLDLSRCYSLRELPESIKELKSLTSLDLSWCSSLVKLPESIKELKSLTSLDLSECSSLVELPESIKELKSLTSLDLSECSSLVELPESIKELKSLTSLDLSWCRSLRELPESIKELKSLTSLDLSCCSSLVELPESIKELKSLTSLDLSCCSSLVELPESIKELKSLRSLDLSECSSMVELPESIKELKSLTSLNLSGCDSLVEFLESIKELKSLTSLKLSLCSSLVELPESIKELKSLTSLKLSLCSSLVELPESIKELKSLTSLDLSYCECLVKLPESIKELKSLTSLNLSECSSLVELPESIKELKSLTGLDLSGCESLVKLPESIKELKSLTSLDLSGCSSLVELPESIKELKSLTSLDLSRCSSLAELLESIKEPKSLRSLDI